MNLWKKKKKAPDDENKIGQLLDNTLVPSEAGKLFQRAKSTFSTLTENGKEKIQNWLGTGGKKTYRKKRKGKKTRRLPN